MDLLLLWLVWYMVWHMVVIEENKLIVTYGIQLHANELHILVELHLLDGKN